MRPLYSLVLLFVSLSANAAPPSMDPAAQQILELFKSNDIVVLGEIHGVHEQRALLASLAGENGKTRSFEAIATEALWSIDQAGIDKFLADGDEKFFFDSGWFASLNVREAFRRFYRNKDKVCAVDIDFEMQDAKKRAVELRTRFQAFPEAKRQLILKRLKKKNVEELIKDESLQDREFGIAEAIDKCLAANRKVLVHLGSDHVSALDPVYHKQAAALEPDTIQWLMETVRPGVKFVAVKNMIEVPADADAAQKALAALYKAKGAAAPFLMPVKDLPANIKKAMTADGVESWRRADYMVVGPLGTPDKKINQ